MTWEYKGFRGMSDKVELECLGSEHGTVVVLGGGRHVWEENRAAHESKWWLDLGYTEPPRYIAVNDIGAYYPGKIDHWFSLHPAYLPFWMGLRLGHALDEGHRPKLHCHKRKPSTPTIDYEWGLDNNGATSGFYAAQVAVCLGYEHILLVGVPGDNTGRFFDAPWETGNYGDRSVTLAWRQMVDKYPILSERVRSVSGWTRELFGAPDTWTTKAPARESYHDEVSEHVSHSH
jgi:hypothetical protein